MHARVFAPAQHDELWPIQRESDFPGTVFGIDRQDVSMRNVTERYTELFGHHQHDQRLD